MKDLILVGKQGSGKGTQGKFLIQDFGYKLFETGQALRNIGQSGTPLGNKVLEITQRGDLVPNEIVMEIVEEFLKDTDADTPILFDGIPRSEPQRISLEALLQKFGRTFEVLEITLSNETAIKRMMGRGRSDDTPEAIAKRLENFEEHTRPLIDTWKSQGKVFEVSGEQEIEEVNALIQNHLRS